jgi:two-component system sensor histidine kinase KdpD
MDKNRLIPPFSRQIFKTGIFPYLISAGFIVVVALLCYPLAGKESYHLVSYILLFVVFMMATFMRIGPVLLAAALSSLIWNFYFIPPHKTLHIEKPEDLLMFALFFSIALLNGVLTTQVRRQEELAREREERTNALFELTKELSKAGSIDEVLAISIQEIKNHFSVNAFFILQDGNNILYSSGRLQKDKKLNSNEYDIAEWSFKNAQEAGAFTSNLSAVEYTFYPLPGTKLVPGVLAVKLDSKFPEEKKTFWLTFITQISNAIEREFLAEIATKAKFLTESDRLYKNLFSSISHELRIPVATIMGASETLLNSSHPLNIQSALFSEIFSASLRLNRLIENLLNMSRLESGLLSVRTDWCDMNDLFNKVAEDLKDELKPFSLQVSIPENMPLVKIDFGLMEQVLYNLLFNSTQYAPVASVIELISAYENGELVVKVADKGPGFPDQELTKVFTKFFRVDGRKTGGLGLGLSIVKGFVEAHNGKITVENITGGGSVFTIKIPSENPEISNLLFDNE